MDGDDAGDAAAEALAELAKRAGRIRLIVFAPIVTLGVGLIVPSYWAAQLAQWELLGVAWSALSAVAGAAPLLAGVALGRALSQSVLRVRLPALARELARRHGISEDEVAELAAILIT